MVELIPYIPIDILFNSKCNYYDSSESREYIKELCISGSCQNASQERIKAGFDLFCQKFEKYKKLNEERMRKIKCFRFGLGYDHRMDYDETYTHIPRALKKVFLCCCSISEEIIIDFNINKLGIDNVKELERIFHPKLKGFSFAGGNLAFDINDDETCEFKRENGAMLEKIEITHEPEEPNPYLENENDNERTKSLCSTLNFLDQFEIKRNIKEYIINWLSFRHNESNELLLDKLFFKDCEKHPSLERIVFKICGLNAHVFVPSLIHYLVQRKQELFVDKEIQEELKHLKSIDIEFSFDSGMIFNRQYHDADILAVDVPMNVNDDNNFVMDGIFATESDQEVITINNVGECIDTLNENIIRWINKIKQNYIKNETIYRRVVLTVKVE